MDVFEAHIHESVWSVAKDLDVEIIIVPANGAGTYQPLDIRTFGILKSIARHNFHVLQCLDRFEETDEFAGTSRCSCCDRTTGEHVAASGSWAAR